VSWLFSQALVAESLAENCLDGKPSVQSKSTATAPAYYVGDKTKEFSRLSRFGMTLQPLTADRGEALLKSFLEVFLAKTFQQPEEEQASPENVRDSGVRWRELSVKYDQDLSSWRTHQCLFQEVLEESSLTLPRWGLMRNGELSERTTPEHLTSETESGFWPTPQVGMIRGENYTLETSFKHWQEGRQVHLSQVLRDQRMWPTPLTSDHKNRGPNSKQQGLSELVRIWPTPSANNYEQTDLDKLLERRERIKSQGINGNGFGLTLANAVLIEERKTWATPRKSDFKSCGPVGSKSHHHMTEKQYLCAQVKEENQPTGHLNPDWTEWLLGWPIGWTDSKQLETDKFQQWWNSHGERLETVD
jgi:hypothetical protein